MSQQPRARRTQVEAAEERLAHRLSAATTHHEPLTASLLTLQARAGNEAVRTLLEHPLQRAATSTTAGTVSDAGTTTADAGTTSADAGTALALRRVGGDLASKKVIQIGWTFDDGPSAVTAEMEGVASFPATWFIMRNQLGTGGAAKGKLAALKKKQAAGMEIAIHSMDAKRDHVAWFPNGGPESYSDIKVAMTDLSSFCAELRGEGLEIHFARAPYGLHTEITGYLGSLGVGGDLKAMARALILGKATASGKDAKAIQKVIDDFAVMKATLSSLGLHEWGGKGAEDPSVSGWEAEDEPAGSGLTDDALSRFTGLVKTTARDGGPHSMVILAHDRELKGEGSSGFQRPAHVGVDVTQMEKLANAGGVRLEYYTMSELFTKVTGKAP